MRSARAKTNRAESHRSGVSAASESAATARLRRPVLNLELRLLERRAGGALQSTP
jgi:hypothetical protein